MNDPRMDNYFRSARSWDDDIRIRTRRSAKIAWTVAGVAVAVSLAMSGVLVTLMPLKTVEPFVIRIDSATGSVDIVRALDREHMEFDEAVSRYFLWQYVLSREKYQPATIADDYRRVVLMSAPALQAQYAGFMDRRNPQGPELLFGDRATVRIALKTISFQQKNVALVRFTRTVDYVTEQADEASDWIATVTFAFHPEAEMRDQDRMVNPFGFQVEDIRTDREPVGGAS